jgi:hypothetical protein
MELRLLIHNPALDIGLVESFPERVPGAYLRTITLIELFLLSNPPPGR